MAGDTPAAEATPAAEGAATDLLEVAAPAEADKSAPEGAAPETPAGETPAAESKPEGDKPAGDDEKGKGDEPAPDLLADDDEGKSPKDKDGQADKSKDGAPETYEAFTLPENVPLDEAALGQATPVFKEVGLSQENAQKLVSLYADIAQQAAEQQVAGFNKLKSDWANELKSDEEFGGDNLLKTVGATKALIGKFGSPRLLGDLKEWGWGNHPEFQRMCARIGAALSEDTLEQGDPAAQSKPKSHAQVLYPNMPGDNQ